MVLSLRLVTPPSTEPITLDEAKLQCRVDTSDEDALLAHYITAARGLVEAESGRALLTQTWEMRIDGWYEFGDGIIRLPYAPTQQVEGIVWLDSDGVSHTVDPNTYLVDTSSLPPRIVPVSSWPTTPEMVSIAGIRITFVAGWEERDKVPAWAKQAILLLVAHWYENREAVASVGNPRDLPIAVDRLLAAHRVWWP